MNIALKDNQLHFDFHKMRFSMTQFHYDRFDTPDDEQDGKWSVNFRTNPQGDIDQAVMSLDEAEAVFVRKPDTIDPKLMSQFAGSYETPGGVKIQVARAPDGSLSLVLPGQPIVPLSRVKGTTFRTPRFSDVILESHSMDGLPNPAWHMAEIRKVVGDELVGITAAVHVPAMLTMNVRGQTSTRQIT